MMVTDSPYPRTRPRVVLIVSAYRFIGVVYRCVALFAPRAREAPRQSYRQALAASPPAPLGSLAGRVQAPTGAQ